MTWAEIGARVEHRGVGLGRGPLDVRAVAHEVRIGSYAWALVEVTEGERPAWGSIRAHFATVEGAMRLDVRELVHVAASVDRTRERAEYLHDCGLFQWRAALGPDQRELAFDDDDGGSS